MLLAEMVGKFEVERWRESAKGELDRWLWRWLTEELNADELNAVLDDPEDALLDKPSIQDVIGKTELFSSHILTILFLFP